MKPTELKRRVAREAKRQIEERGFTRKRIEQHIRKLLRPRPRWIPRGLWAAGARIFIRGVDALEQAETEECERVLVNFILDGESLERLAPLITRIRGLRARVAQGSAQ